MKLDQIAFYAHDETQVTLIKRQFGLEGAEWVEDIAEGDVSVHGAPWSRSKAHLRFNYDLGVELEILTYLEGPHWHQRRPEFLAGKSFLSHLGVHMDDGDLPARTPFLVQHMVTHVHSNPYLLERGRTYEYRIYDYTLGKTAFHMGADLKYIWRDEK